MENTPSVFRVNVTILILKHVLFLKLDDTERPQPDNLLSFMLHELVVFLGYHSQIVSYPYVYSLALHSVQLWSFLLYRCFLNENSHEKLMFINK